MTEAELRKRCPDCAELVQPEARICRFCRFNFDTGESGAPTSAGGGSAPASPPQTGPQDNLPLPAAPPVQELSGVHDEHAVSVPAPTTAARLRQGSVLRAKWSSFGRKTKIVLVLGSVLLGIALLGALLPDSNRPPSDSESAAPTTTTSATTTARLVKDHDGWSCGSDRTEYGLCPGNPFFGKKPAAARRARRQAAAAKARREAVRREREQAEARTEAARIAAENAWHSGYNQQDENVYWKWIEGRSCEDYVQNGCWHVAVITRDGCSSYVAVNANEYQGGTIVNQLLDNQGYGIPAKTPRIFELDADSSGATAGDVTIDCN